MRQLSWHQRAMVSAEALFLKGDAAEERGDFAAARAAFEKGAELGDEFCLSRLAVMFDVGLGVVPDKGKSLRLYIQAWRRGSFTAGNNLAILYRERGNLRGELRWFQRAADRGDDGAKIELAKHYLNGTSAQFSPQRALRLLAEAKTGGALSEAEFEEADAIIANLRPKLASTNGN